MTKEEIRIEFNKIRDDFIKTHNKCQYCGEKAEHIHHLIPILVGGDNRSSNLIPLCMKCHGLIHNKHYTEKWKLAQKAGIEKAKAEGKFLGRKSIKPDNWDEKYNQWIKREIPTKVALAKELNISRPTLDAWIKEKENMRETTISSKNC